MSSKRRSASRSSRPCWRRSCACGRSPCFEVDGAGVRARRSAGHGAGQGEGEEEDATQAEAAGSGKGARQGDAGADPQVQRAAEEAGKVVLYVSPRGGGKPQRFSGILLEGLAPDGGLYVPESFPRADLARWRRLPYVELAKAILREFMDDVPNLDALVER